MNRVFSITLLILLGLGVGYLLGGFVLAHQDNDRFWSSYLSAEWNELCEDGNPNCTPVELDLRDEVNFQVANMPIRYSLGENLTGRWDLLITERDRAMISLTGPIQ